MYYILFTSTSFHFIRLFENSLVRRIQGIEEHPGNALSLKKGIHVSWNIRDKGIEFSFKRVSLNSSLSQFTSD